MSEVITIGLDIAKNVFQVHGVDDAGRTVIRRRLRRSQGWCQTKTTRSPKIGHPAHLRPQKVRATRRGRRSD
jgi:transposase